MAFDIILLTTSHVPIGQTPEDLSKTFHNEPLGWSMLAFECLKMDSPEGKTLISSFDS